MAKNKNVEKARPKNLTIGARITISTVCAIMIPLIIIASASTFLLRFSMSEKLSGLSGWLSG